MMLTVFSCVVAAGGVIFKRHTTTLKEHAEKWKEPARIVLYFLVYYDSIQVFWLSANC